MNIKTMLICLFSCFVFVFAYDFIVHGYLLMETYQQTPHLWRGEEDCNMWMMVISQLLFSGVLTYIYCNEFTKTGLAAGARFGLHVGLILATLDLGKYAYMPISFGLAASWAVSSIIGAIGGCVVIALAYEKVSE